MDLCGSPGGFCQVLVSKGADVITVSLYDDYFDNVKKNRFVERKICDVEDVKLDEKFFLIVADGANEFSYKSNEVFMKEWNVAKNCLQLDGVLIIKHNNYFKMNKEVALLKDFFERIELYKPEMSCEGNTEVYIICEGYRKKNKSYINMKKNKFKIGIESYLSCEENCWTEDEILQYLNPFVDLMDINLIDIRC